MARKTATVRLQGSNRFAGSVGSGHEIVLDDGAADTGMRPAELIPLALAGCTAMDVISILRKKHQDVRSYAVEAAGTQADSHPSVFTRIDVVHIVEGPHVEVEAVRRAIELSATKYCAVGATLASGVTEVHHAYLVRDDATGESSSGEVLVLGPGSTLGAPADPVAIG
jgi:putative redox protein